METPSINDLQKAKTAKPSVVLSADDQEFAVFKRANREGVRLAEMFPTAMDALIATEDHHFMNTTASISNAPHRPCCTPSRVTCMAARP